LSGVPSHIHVVDNRQISYPNDKCPICRPEVAQEQQAQAIPNVHTKGQTVVMQVSKGQMSTTTWWAEGKCFLHSVRHISRSADNKVIRGSDGNPVWTQLTMRINIPLMIEYMLQVSTIIKQLETSQPVPATQVPQRA